MAKKRKVPVLWRRGSESSKRKIVTHVGIEPGAKAICGRPIPPGSIEPEGEAALEESLRELCAGCSKRLRGQGPWTNENGWVRPALFVQPNIGGDKEAWQLNELTWQRVLALIKRQKMTRKSVMQLAQVAFDAAEDPNQQLKAKALDADHLIAWAAIVAGGWWPDASLEDEALRLFMAWDRALADDDET